MRWAKNRTKVHDGPVDGPESDGPDSAEPESDAAELLGKIASDEERHPGLFPQLSVALAKSAVKAGSGAVASGKWLSDVVVDAAPRIPVRDLATLRQHHKGLSGEELADALVRNAVLSTAAVGVVGGSVTAIKWTVPVTLVTLPLQLAVETAAIAAIEIKLVAELHEVYGVAIGGTGTQRGAAYALSWANRRGVNPLEPATMTLALGVVARQRVQRRLVGRAGRGIGTFAPLMLGAAYGAVSNRKQTLALADSLRADLRRRRPLVGGLTGLAMSHLLDPQLRPRRVFRRRVRTLPPGSVSS
jgi:hypothetical protein